MANNLARMFHESPAATADMTVLPRVLGCRTLWRTVQVRLRSNPLRLHGGTSFSTVSRRQLKLPATSCREASKCKVFLPFYCSSLATPA
ncbi:MAG: hypothetical protein P8X67_12430, partial [Syntrophobacterales bacterium]